MNAQRVTLLNSLIDEDECLLKDKERTDLVQTVYCRREQYGVITPLGTMSHEIT